MYKAKENILHEVVAVCVIYKKIIRGSERRGFFEVLQTPDSQCFIVFGLLFLIYFRLIMYVFDSFCSPFSV